MTNLLGVDGARGGWVGALVPVEDATGGAVQLAVVPDGRGGARWLRREAESMPADLPRDALGRPMRIVV